MTVSPPRTRPVPAREQGYATLAAVALIAILALASLGMVWGNRAAIDQASAELGQARVDAIARRSRCNKRMLYHYYRNKAGLFQAVLHQKIVERMARVEEAAA